MRHEYFTALEVSGSLGPHSGWTPCFVTLESDDGRLQAAIPLFEKTDSRGEFIFDWDWAAAMRRVGRPYYPKLVAAIPFTPVPGRRCLLVDAEAPALAAQLIAVAKALARERGCSSLHWLFVAESELKGFEASAHMIRSGCDFVWHNPGADDFDAWLAELTARGRKKILRERRRVHEAGIQCVWRNGHELDKQLLEVVYTLYASTYYQHGMFPYLSKGFFGELAARMPAALRVCFAYRDDDVLACAVFMQDDTSLYGRYWGAVEWINSLHFELCYYQGIAYALQNGLQHFHPGVQGEHKLLRGFEPTTHYSAHWLQDQDLTRAIAGFLEQEHSLVTAYMQEAETLLPFRHDKG